jgi:predicted transposase YbfD/YdcC
LEKGKMVHRTLVARPLTGETACFPLVAQAARLCSRAAHQLRPRDWLAANIAHWDIETGLHARLDASRHDDRCRLRRPRALCIHGLFNRWANSLFMHWRHRHHHTTTDFIAAMAENHDRRAVSAATSKRFPS